MSWEDKKDRIYVGDLNYSDEVCSGEDFSDEIELVEITLREEVVYDVSLTLSEKAVLAKALDELNVPVLQIHTHEAAEVIAACRDAGVTKRFEVLCRPYHPYGFDDWRDEIRTAVRSGAEMIHASITTPRKWAMGEQGVTAADVGERALDAVKFALDEGAAHVTLGFTDVPRTDLGFLVDVGGRGAELGASTILLNDTVGVAKPAAIKHIVKTMRSGTGAGIRVHCHNDFGLATANTLAALEAGAIGAELLVNGADPARSGIAALAEVVMALLCLYRRDIGIVTEKLTEASYLFADATGMPIAEQAPVVAERNWMYKRDHIMRTIIQDESIQLPYSPALVGEHLRYGMGRGTGRVGVSAKLALLGLTAPEDKIDTIVERVSSEAVIRKRRLDDDEFRQLVSKVIQG